MSNQNEYENLLSQVEEYLSKVNIPNPSEEEKKISRFDEKTVGKENR